MSLVTQVNDIAIIGMSGRFPMARSVTEFWQNIQSGRECIKFFTDEELKSSGVASATFDDPHFVKAAALIDGADTFDAEFFGYTAKEAELMDPQHRVLLEAAWEALEHAGYDPLGCGRPVGVFAGATINTYLLLNVVSRPEITDSLEDVQINVS
ncbi:MAG: beta-ketoacyl synthase N-terminal-like domain-containing protein, partial [Blastocatellia bacterium]